MRWQRAMRRTVALIAGLVLAAGMAMANGGGHLWGSTWTVAGVGELALEPADGVTIDFTDGRILGMSGCNRYTGAVTLQADRITVGPVASTRMACPGRAMTIEQSFLGALEHITHWRIDDDGALELLAEGAPLIRAVVTP